jgi:hypothetical protein
MPTHEMHNEINTSVKKFSALLRDTPGSRTQEPGFRPHFPLPPHCVTLGRGNHGGHYACDQDSIVLVRVERAIPLISPAYDQGKGEEEIRASWLQYWAALYGRLEDLDKQIATCDSSS